MRGKAPSIKIIDAIRANPPRLSPRRPVPIPKYPLDTASKLALIRAAGWYYDVKKKLLRDPAGSPIGFLNNGYILPPLNEAFHWFILHQGKHEEDSDGN